jgi:hypothetical protein
VRLESAIVDRIESLIRHPVFARSDRAMDLVLDDLESLEWSGQGTYRRLCEMILRSPHLVSSR